MKNCYNGEHQQSNGCAPISNTMTDSDHSKHESWSATLPVNYRLLLTLSSTSASTPL